MAAREELVQRHLPLVRSLARRFAGRGESLEDLEQVGAIGLIKAIDRFEMSREVALTSYATPNIVGEIKRHFRDRGSAIRIPRNLKELSAKLGKAMERLTATQGRSPTIADALQGPDAEPGELTLRRILQTVVDSFGVEEFPEGGIVVRLQKAVRGR